MNIKSFASYTPAHPIHPSNQPAIRPPLRHYEPKIPLFFWEGQALSWNDSTVHESLTHFEAFGLRASSILDAVHLLHSTRNVGSSYHFKLCVQRHCLSCFLAAHYAHVLHNLLCMLIALFGEPYQSTHRTNEEKNVNNLKYKRGANMKLCVHLLPRPLLVISIYVDVVAAV